MRGRTYVRACKCCAEPCRMLVGQQICEDCAQRYQTRAGSRHHFAVDSGFDRAPRERLSMSDVAEMAGVSPRSFRGRM